MIGLDERQYGKYSQTVDCQISTENPKTILNFRYSKTSLGCQKTFLDSSETNFSVLKLPMKCSKYWIWPVFSLFLLFISRYDSNPRSNCNEPSGSGLFGFHLRLIRAKLTEWLRRYSCPKLRSVFRISVDIWQSTVWDENRAVRPFLSLEFLVPPPRSSLFSKTEKYWITIL